MASDSSVFPLILAVREDGSVESTMAGFEQSILASTTRAAGGFSIVRRQVDELNQAAAQKINDPLGINASMRALSLSPVQKIFDQFAAGSAKAAQAQQQARVQAVAAIEQQTAAALAGIRAEQAARSAALSQAAREGASTVALQKQQASELAQLAASPQRVAGIALDPGGIAQASAAARAFAIEQDAIAAAAERSAASVGRAALADRGYAIAARQAADAAGAEAQRLEAQAGVHARVAQQVAAAGVRIGAAGGAVVTSAGQQRIGLQQLGFQLNDVATQFASGSKASIIFAQQSGQVIQALQLMGGGTKGLLGFLGGPWGIVLTTAAVALSPFVAKLFDTSENAKKAEAATKALAQQVGDIGAFFDQATGKITETNKALVTYAILSRQMRNDELRSQQVGNAKAGGAARSESIRDLAPAFAERGLGASAPRGRVNLDVDNALRSRDRDAALLAIARSKSSNAALAQRLIEQRGQYQTAAGEIAKNDKEIESLLSGRLDASLRRGGASTGSGGVRSAGGGGAARSGSTDVAAEARRQAEALSATLATVVGRYDAVRAAAIAYGKEVAEIAKLEAAGPDKGGISAEEANRYRTTAAAARDKAIADDRARAAEALITPVQRATAELGQQRVYQEAVAAGDERRADIIQLQTQLQERFKVSAGEALDIATRQVDAEDALAAKKERTLALIDAQVAAARRVQNAFTDFFENPFAKGGLDTLTAAQTKSRQRLVAEQLSTLVFKGDLGSQVHDALTRNAQPLIDAADRHVTAATALTGAAQSITAAAGRLIAPANDNPSIAQLSTTPTAYQGAGFTTVPELPGDITVTGRRTASPSVLGQLGGALFGIGGGLRVLGDGIETQTQKDQRRDLLVNKQTIALSLAAQAIGGKGGAAINSLLNARDTIKLGADIAKGLGGKLGGTVGGAVAGLGVGMATGSVLDLLGIKGTKTGASIGGAVGGAALGPLGAIGGSIVGGLIGSLFYKAPKGQAGVTVNNGIASATSGFGTSAAAVSQANGLAGAVSSGLQSIADQLGGIIGGSTDVQIGTYKGQLRVNDHGGAIGGVKGSGAISFDTEQAAISYAISDAVKDGVITGLSRGTQALIRSGANLDRQIQKALSFEGVFSQLKALKDPIGAASDAIDKELANLRGIFDEASATAEERAQLEELYALKRADALKQAEQQASGQLRDFVDSLNYKADSGLSLRTRESSSMAALAPLIAQITAGKTVDQGQYTAAAQVYLDIERQLYGSTAKYFDALSNITGLTSKAIANTAAPNVTSIGDAAAKAAQAAADAAVASQTSFTIPEDRVAMMTADQFSSVVASGVGGLEAEMRAVTAAVGQLTRVTAASASSGSDTSSGIPAIYALRHA